MIVLKERSPQECINRILRDVEKRRNIQPMDLTDRNTVRRYNAAMDRIKDNAYHLFEHHPNHTDLFLELVKSSDYAVASHCAHLLYGMKMSTIEQKKLALSVVKKLINHPDAPELSKLGMSMNVKQWETELAEHI